MKHCTILSRREQIFLAVKYVNLSHYVQRPIFRFSAELQLITFRTILLRVKKISAGETAEQYGRPPALSRDSMPGPPYLLLINSYPSLVRSHPLTKLFLLSSMTDIQKIDVNEEQHERPMPTDYQNHGKSEETRGFALQRTEGDVEPEIHFVTW